jgi:hypothetical protein
MQSSLSQSTKEVFLNEITVINFEHIIIYMRKLSTYVMKKYVY